MSEHLSTFMTKRLSAQEIERAMRALPGVLRSLVGAIMKNVLVLADTADDLESARVGE